MFLVDTNVVSAGAPYQSHISKPLIQWMDVNSPRLFLSAITIAEIEDGIVKAQRQGAKKKAALLGEWFELVLYLYVAKILPFDLQAARIAGRLTDRARAAGQDPGFEDMAIAATAQAHGLIILTRNLRHFTFLGVRAHDPFDSLPE